MWNTIAATRPDAFLLLGDNIYSDAPKSPEMQHYCYYRRQSRPEYRAFTSQTPIYSIWDDHDFGTNDCQGGPDIDIPDWKRPVWNVFRKNWVNSAYGGGQTNPGIYYDFYIGNIHFIMLDGRYYRNLNKTDSARSDMLGPVQLAWLKKTIGGSTGRLKVLCSPVPWVFQAKGDSKDTWNGFKEQRHEIFGYLTKNKVTGVVLMSADRHRSDLWKIPRENDYPLYEFNSSRLTNQHVHPEMKQAEFSYNRKQSFGTVEFDTTVKDPTIRYQIHSIDGEEIFTTTIHANELR
jgi:alkaline phosphatase D